MKKKIMTKKIQKIVDILWLALVAVLPITSVPLFAKIMHSSSVAPASIFFLVLLVLFWLPVYIKNNGVFPFQIRVALLFFFTALISTFVSVFYNLPAYKDNNFLPAIFEGIATFIIGFLFYLITVIMPNSDKKLANTLKVLNWSGAVMIFWAVFYLTVTYFADGRIVMAFRNIQSHLTTSMLFVNRASGFTSEPSWQADILNMVYLPFWIAASISNYSVYTKKVWKFSFENLLLAGGFITLFLTFSRAGIFASFLVLAFIFVKLNIYVIKKISQKFNASRLRSLYIAILIILVITLYLLVVFGCILLLKKLDPRMSEIFSIQLIKQSGFAKYFDKLQFGERVTYWQTGWRIFNEYPVLGVGLGNSGFFFKKLLPDNAWQLAEVRRLLYYSPSLMNIKSLWVRILAETGIVGFSVFFVLLTVTGITAHHLTLSESRMQKSVGWMGIFMLIAFIIEGFSVDSFALPYLWFTLGLVAATWRWSNNKEKVETHG